VPGAGRVGGLFRLEPSTLARLDAVVEARAVVDVLAVVVLVAGRFAAAAVEVELVSGRRGGAVSAPFAAEEAILFFGVVDAAEGEAAGAVGCEASTLSWGAEEASGVSPGSLELSLISVIILGPRPAVSSVGDIINLIEVQDEMSRDR